MVCTAVENKEIVYFEAFLPFSLSLTGTKKLEYAGSTWHEGCFICNSCQQPIGSKSFIPDKDDHYCVPCYENKFALRCTRCKQVSGGVLLAFLPEIHNHVFLISPHTHFLYKKSEFWPHLSFLLHIRSLAGHWLTLAVSFTSCPDKAPYVWHLGSTVLWNTQK